MAQKIRVGIVGCGRICDQYFHGCRAYEVLELVACADLDFARARAKATEHRLLRALSVADLLAAPDIDLVVNLTVPRAHVELNEAALRAGKHVYTEKPFALDARSGARVLALAEERGLLVGGAPDTFLGGGLQTARRAIDEGMIGQPVAAMAFMLCHGHEFWHPAPEFFYQKGGGPMFDMGPYYLTALVNLLGPAIRVTGSTRASFPERTVTSQPLAGAKVNVEVPTHQTGTIDFASGAIATVVMSFDTWPGPALPPLVIHGSEGTLEVPDPNRFDGDVQFYRPDHRGSQRIAPVHSCGRGRGTGVADMAYSLLRRDRPHRVTGELANHVVEIMEAFDLSSVTGTHVSIRSTCPRPAPLPVALPDHRLDP